MSLGLIDYVDYVDYVDYLVNRLSKIWAHNNHATAQI